MAEIQWIKLDVSIFDNRKIKQIKSLPDGNSLIVIWLQLLCLAGNVNDYGKIYLTDEIPYTEQMLATAFNEPLSTIQMALSIFQKFNMIEIVNDIIYISNWEKYQAIEGMERAKELHRIRQKNYRERKKLLENNRDVSVTSQVTQSDAIDIEEDKEKELEIEYISAIDSNNAKKPKKGRKKQFTPPTLEEIEAYIKEKGLNVNPTKFFNYFEASEWIDSTGKPVLNWKQKLIVWDTHEYSKKKQKEEIVYQSTGSTLNNNAKNTETDEWFDNFVKGLNDEQLQ